LLRWVLLASLCLALAPAAAHADVQWLCRPGADPNPCMGDQTTTYYAPDGTSTVSRPDVPADPPVDCFYVYPTVSNQPTQNADKSPDPEIRSIALYQAARFSQLCQVYAPVYRQATVPALQAGKTTKSDYLTAYGDVEKAFVAFLRRIGPHRGFVLIGHSQGTFHLQRLIRRRIDDKPALRRRLVSAVLLGGDVTVRKGSDRGGVFRHVPTCKRPAQLACVIAFSTFNETPPDLSIFGRGGSGVDDFLGLPHGHGLETACTNPADLRHNRSVKLTSVVPREPIPPSST